jgi:charged multivesicular body protein 4
MALNALKKKKRYDKQLQQIDGTLTTIEQQREALEGANTNTAVLQTMKRLIDITTPKVQFSTLDIFKFSTPDAVLRNLNSKNLFKV